MRCPPSRRLDGLAVERGRVWSDSSRRVAGAKITSEVRFGDPVECHIELAQGREYKSDGTWSGDGRPGFTPTLSTATSPSTPSPGSGSRNSSGRGNCSPTSRSGPLAASSRRPTARRSAARTKSTQTGGSAGAAARQLAIDRPNHVCRRHLRPDAAARQGRSCTARAEIPPGDFCALQLTKMENASSSKDLGCVCGLMLHYNNSKNREQSKYQGIAFRAEVLEILRLYNWTCGEGRQ